MRGIAFVHGIGQQKQGETLRLFSEALGSWLQQWLTEKPGTDLRVTRAELEPPSPAVGAALAGTEITDPDDPKAPAHTILTVCPPGAAEQEILIAECWWADAFEPPKLGELVFWLTLIAPTLVLSQAATPLRRSWRRLHLTIGAAQKPLIGLRMIPQTVFLLSSVALIPILVGVLAVILLPALLPISSLQQAARRAAVLVVGYLGDAFVLTASPIRRDVITSVVQADLDWLSQRCDELSVVGHSQGAVLAHDALRRRRPANLKQFVTLGAGLEKLLRLRLLFRNERGIFAQQWIGVAAAAVLIATSFAATSAFATHHPNQGLELTIAAAFAAIVLGLGYVFAFQRVAGYEELVRIPGAGSEFEWFNYYASSDPVPNGPLIDTEQPWITEREVFNYASIIRDHTSYLRNRDEILPRLARILLDTTILTEADDTLLMRRARTRRRIRTRFLGIGRTLILTAAITATILLWGSLQAFGHTIRTHLPAASIPPLRHLLTALPNSINTPHGRGIIAWTIAWLAAYSLFALLLSLWGRVDLKLLIAHEPANRHAFSRVLDAGLAGTITLTLLAFTIDAGISDRYTDALRAASLALLASSAATILLAVTVGPRWLQTTENRLTHRWLEQAKRQTYQPLALAPALAKLRRIITP